MSARILSVNMICNKSCDETLRSEFCLNLPRQDFSAYNVAVVDPAIDERLEGAGHAQVLRQLLQRCPRVLPDELVRVGRAREQDLH